VLREARVLSRRLASVARRLGGVYGRPQRRLSDPLDALVETVLSQNTSDLNSARAFRQLKLAYPTWASLVKAGPQRLERVIRSGGLARTKSRRLVTLLKTIKRREGRYDLGFLRRLDASSACERLTRLPGVGPKTRACVLLFACGHPAFPVDTHVHRIVGRLGLVPRAASAAAAQALLEPAVPARRALDLHLNLIRLGREVCRPRQPRCVRCPVRRGCRYYREAH
jgi:endonuclease-3